MGWAFSSGLVLKTQPKRYGWAQVKYQTKIYYWKGNKAWSQKHNPNASNAHRQIKTKQTRKYLPTILLFFAAQNQQKTYAHFMHFPLFFFWKKTIHPSQKELTPNLKEKPTETIKSAAISLKNTWLDRKSVV